MAALDAAISRVCSEASLAIREQGAKAIYLTDRTAGNDRVPIPSLIVVGAVHQHLLRERSRHAHRHYHRRR